MHNLQNGWTALMSASKNGHTTVVETLLQHGASVDKQKEVNSWNTILCCMDLHTTWALLYYAANLMLKCIIVTVL